MKKFNLHEPYLQKDHFKNLSSALKVSEISTYGNFPEKCSSLIKLLTKSKYVTLLNSGSSALFASFKSIGLKKNDLVITSNYTFIATINAIHISNGVPWIFDTEKNSPNINLDLIEQSLEKETFKNRSHYYRKKDHKRIYSICPIYVNGKILDFKRIFKIAKKYNLKIINDCAGSFLSVMKNKNILKYSDISISSFNGNKCPSAGMGGCAITNNRKYSKFIENFCENFSTKIKYLHSYYGYNCRITNLHASLLFSELRYLKETITKKNKIYEFYLRNIKVNNKFKIYTKKKNEVIWINKLLFSDPKNSKKAINDLNKNKINTENFWITMSEQPFLKKKFFFVKNKFKFSECYSKRIVPLPSSVFLDNNDLKYICEKINDLIK